MAKARSIARNIHQAQPDCHAPDFLASYPSIHSTTSTPPRYYAFLSQHTSPDLLEQLPNPPRHLKDCLLPEYYAQYQLPNQREFDSVIGQADMVLKTSLPPDTIITPTVSILTNKPLNPGDPDTLNVPHRIRRFKAKNRIVGRGDVYMAKLLSRARRLGSPDPRMDTFVPTPIDASVRVLLVISLETDATIASFDIKNAFTTSPAPTDEDYYIHINTKNQRADVMTKAQPRTTLEYQSDLLEQPPDTAPD
jgi:hypothetical protein